MAADKDIPGPTTSEIDCGDAGERLIAEDEMAVASLRSATADRFLKSLGFDLFDCNGYTTLDRIFCVLTEANLLDVSGSVLMSSEATLRESTLYFLGLNPGGDEEGNSSFPTIRESLALARMGCNAFDQDWSRARATFLPGAAPMQANFKTICAHLGQCYSEVPASNLVFTRSRDVSSHGLYEVDLERGMEVHRILLDAIRPRFIWFMGSLSNASEQLRIVNVEWERADYRDWYVGRGTVEFCGKDYLFGNTPHLSYWSPAGREKLLDWVFAGLSD